MSTQIQGSRDTYTFGYETCRNISTQNDKDKQRRVLCGYAPMSSFCGDGLKNDENVRDYLPDAPGKAKHAPSNVHLRIRDTLENNPEDFAMLNGGICIVAKGVQADDSKRLLVLDSPSIINGAQTRGEIKRFLKSGAIDGYEPRAFFQIIALELEDSADRENLVADIAVARNFQNNVKGLSIAGRKGEVDELEEALQRDYPDLKLRKSEGDFLGEDTELLLQVVLAIMPPSLLILPDKGVRAKNKGFTYSAKATCLKIYRGYYEGRDGDFKEQYQFFLDHIATARNLYRKWKRHPGFDGTGLHIGKGKARGADGIANGLVFPILAAHAPFFHKSDDKWELNIPKRFDAKEFIVKYVKPTYMQVARSNPNVMGKDLACYSALENITELMVDMAPSP